MGVLVYVLGRSGTGKSYSMRNFKKEEIGVINVQGKILPFKGFGKWDVENTDDSRDIVLAIKSMAKKHKTIVVDDFQYVMANEFMRRATEYGYNKFTEIARHAWDIANCVRELANDIIVYILCHTDTDQDGFEKLKTIGKLLDEKIVLEGMSTIVLKTTVSDSQYMFLTQNNGKDTVKSPAGMFPSYAIDNDLKYVDEKIRNYYELGKFLTNDEIAEIDETMKKDDVPPDTEKKKKGRRNVKKEEKLEEALAEKEEEKVENEPKSSSRRKRVNDDMAEERAEIQKQNDKIIANNGIDENDEREDVSFDEVELPEIKEVPRRKKRNEELIEEPIEESNEEEKPTRRRRRRA